MIWADGGNIVGVFAGKELIWPDGGKILGVVAGNGLGLTVTEPLYGFRRKSSNSDILSSCIFLSLPTYDAPF